MPDRPDEPPQDRRYTVYGGGSPRRPRPPRAGADGEPRPRRRDEGGPAGPRDGRRRPAGPRGDGRTAARDDARQDGDAPATGGRPPGGEPPAPYTVYEARRRLGRGRAPGASGAGAPPDGPGRRRRRVRPPRGLAVRILRGALCAAVAWVALSLVLFLVSAQVHQDGGPADELLGGGGAPFGATNMLVLGTDERPEGSKEPGAEGRGGTARTDTMLLSRTGGFSNNRLSIPRDTIVEIDGRRQKINAAFALDGTRGAVGAVERLTGIDVHHVAQMDFANFPGLVDAMGGIRFTPKTCVRAEVSGGARRARPNAVTSGTGRWFGGTSFRLRRGETYALTGRQTLALARVRKNDCRVGQNDLDRAARQQQILSAMKRRVLSPAGFMRLPFIAWKAPQAVKTDMGGLSLLGVAIGQFLPGGGSSQVLKPSGFETLPDGGQGLVVDQETIERARREFEE